MINLELTPEVKKWLDTEPENRDLQAGADLLLRITRNRILYANLTRNLRSRAEAIEYQLKKIYQQRLNDITHEEVKEMMHKVDGITSARGLDKPQSTASRSEYQRGKRADHDELPLQVQQLYVDNADILRRMRDTHTKLRLISPETSTCPDSDRYPLAKYLIEQDRLYRENWNKYDHYIKGSPVENLSTAVDARSESKNAEKLCHLLLGQYAKNNSEQTAVRIRDAYSKIISPSEKLRKKMLANNFQV